MGSEKNAMGRLFQQRSETSLFEMMIASQCVLDPTILHDDKGNAIGERPLLVQPLRIEFPAARHKAATRWDDPNGRVHSVTFDKPNK